MTPARRRHPCAKAHADGSDVIFICVEPLRAESLPAGSVWSRWDALHLSEGGGVGGVWGGGGIPLGPCSGSTHMMSSSHSTLPPLAVTVSHPSPPALMIPTHSALIPSSFLCSLFFFSLNVLLSHICFQDIHLLSRSMDPVSVQCLIVVELLTQRAPEFSFAALWHVFVLIYCCASRAGHISVIPSHENSRIPLDARVWLWGTNACGRCVWDRNVAALAFFFPPRSNVAVPFSSLSAAEHIPPDKMHEQRAPVFVYLFAWQCLNKCVTWCASAERARARLSVK